MKKRAIRSKIEDLESFKYIFHVPKTFRALR